MLKKALEELYSWDSYADEGYVRQASADDWVDDLTSNKGFDPQVARIAVMIHDEVHGLVGGVENLERFKTFIDLAF